MMSLGLFACNKDKPAEPPAEPAQTTTVTETNTNTKTLTVATTADFPPFSFADEKGVMSGLDIDILHAIAKNKGFNIQFKPTKFERLFIEIESKSSDIAASAIFQTEERISKYGVTNAYYDGAPVFYYFANNPKLANANPTSLSDLGGKNLDLVASTGTKLFDDMSTITNVKSATELKTDYLGFTSIIQNKADVAFTDDAILKSIISNHLKGDASTLKIVPYAEKSNYVFLVNKEDTELLKTLNEGIDELVKSGEIKVIAKKYGLE